VKRHPLEFLDPAEVSLARDQHGLTLTAGTRVIPGLVPVRSFPYSGPHNCIALRDASGVTVGILENLDGLDQTSARLLQEVLTEQVLSPEILEVVDLQHHDRKYFWTVETSCGPRTFTTRLNMSELAVTCTPSGELVVRADDGIRFRIRSLSALSARSRELLMPVV
jgi:hypothetical protein